MGRRQFSHNHFRIKKKQQKKCVISVECIIQIYTHTSNIQRSIAQCGTLTSSTLTHEKKITKKNFFCNE